MNHGGKYCKLCEGTNCNKKIKPQQCVRCSSEDDENCIRNPSIAPTLECDHYDDKCITTIHKNESIVRDCQRNSAVEEKFCDENPWLCHICETDNCNTISTIDKYCYECDSKTNPDCATKIDESMLVNCPFSANNPGCYHFINESGISQLIAIIFSHFYFTLKPSMTLYQYTILTLKFNPL